MFCNLAKWTNEQLSGFGLTESLLIPSILTDTGMATVGKVFPHLVHLDIYNCPHLIDPTGWIPSGYICIFILHQCILYFESLLMAVENLEISGNLSTLENSEN